LGAKTAFARNRAAASNWPTPAFDTLAVDAPMAEKPAAGETPSTGGIPSVLTPSRVFTEATYCSVVSWRSWDLVDARNAGQPSDGEPGFEEDPPESAELPLSLPLPLVALPPPPPPPWPGLPAGS
jgi:hypothetical protein